MHLNYRCSEAVEDAKNHIIDYLVEMEGETVELSDVGFLCTEDENNSGVWIVGYDKSIETAMNNYGVSSFVVNNFETEYGTDFAKLFWENPEKFWCACMITLCETLWRKAIDISKFDSEEVVVDDNFIEEVRSALDKFDSAEQILDEDLV